MKILLLGADGQVGHELAKTLPAFAEVTRPSRAEVDLANVDRLREAVAFAGPDVIVNAAAYNAVDAAESEPDVALRVNGEAVAALGEEAARRRIALVTFSTDFVFDGTKGSAYTETDPPNPVSAYGRSKLAGERALAELDAPALVLRTAWVYSLRRPCFVQTILRLARERREIRIVTDQVGNPTWCRALARATTDIVRSFSADPFASAQDAKGVYHLAGSGVASRFDLARAVLDLDPNRHEHLIRKLEPALSDEFRLPAARPPSGALDGAKARARFGVSLPPWRESLLEAFATADFP